LLFLLSFLFLLPTLEGAQGQAQPKLKTVWKELMELRKNFSSTTNMMSLNPTMSQRYILRVPRNYSLILFFTSRNPQCAACKFLDPQIKLLEYSWRTSTPEDAPLFIFRIIAERNMELFNQLSVTNVPVLLHLPPSETGWIVQEDQKYPFQRGAIAAGDFAAWARTQTGVEIIIWEPWWMKHQKLFFVSLLFLIIRPIYKSRHHFQNSYFWFSAALAIFFISIGGIVFDAIRNPPLFGSAWSGEFSLIDPHYGSHFVVEGLLLSFLHIAAGLLFVAIWSLAPTMKGGLMQRILFYTLFLLLVGIVSSIFKIFCFKSGSLPYCPYNPIDFLASRFKRYL